jgi:hypothetical protein
VYTGFRKCSRAGCRDRFQKVPEQVVETGSGRILEQGVAFRSRVKRDLEGFRSRVYIATGSGKVPKQGVATASGRIPEKV